MKVLRWAMSLLWIVVSLLFIPSCKTLPLEGAREAESFVSPQGEIYLLIDVVDQRWLVDEIAQQWGMDQPLVKDMLDESRYLLASRQEGQWTIELLGRYPIGRMGMALKKEEGWVKDKSQGETLYINEALGYRVSSSSLLLFPGGKIPEESYFHSLREGEDQPILLSLHLGRELLREQQDRTGGMKDMLHQAGLGAYALGDEMQIDIHLQASNERERALNGAARIFLLSLLGPAVMDSQASIQEGWVSFENIILTKEEWQRRLSLWMEEER